MGEPKPTSPLKMLIIALIILILVFIYLINYDNPSKEVFWFIRVLTALSAGAISMSLSGSINVGTKNELQTLAEKTPKITATGALAVFIIVYLFNPIG